MNVSNWPVLFVDLKVVGTLTNGWVERKGLIQVTCFWGTKAVNKQEEHKVLLSLEWNAFQAWICSSKPAGCNWSVKWLQQYSFAFLWLVLTLGSINWPGPGHLGALKVSYISSSSKMFFFTEEKKIDVRPGLMWSPFCFYRWVLYTKPYLTQTSKKAWIAIFILLFNFWQITLWLLCLNSST